MNVIQVNGGNKFQREIAEKVVGFCIKELLPRFRTLEIVVNIKKIKGDAVGYCMMEDTNREFEIEVDRELSLKDFITTLTHEMVHVKQYARGETKDVNQFTKSWKGEEYISLYSTVDEYMALPWEKEAYELQEVLCNDYKLLKLKELKK